MWTATKTKNAARNAFRHFKDHGGDFNAKNALDYVRQANQFLLNPPAGTMTRARTNGDILRYNPNTNTFGVLDANGIPKPSSNPIQASMAFRRTGITLMHNNEKIMRCQVCGLLQSEPPWGCDGKSPTYDFCSCCGVEFGYGDASLVAIRQWRQKWIEKGAEWDDSEKKPVNWDWQEQVSQVEELQFVEPRP